MRDELLRTVAAMKRARDLFRGGEILEGYEVSVDGIRLYVGRYFGQADLNEQCVHKGAAVFSPSSPVLPYIVTFQVGKISAEKRPMLSVICALSLENLLHKPFQTFTIDRITSKIEARDHAQQRMLQRKSAAWKSSLQRRKFIWTSTGSQSWTMRFCLCLWTRATG